MEGPPLGPGGEDITWPDQVASRGRKASSTRKIKPQTSNRKSEKLKKSEEGRRKNAGKGGGGSTPGGIPGGGNPEGGQENSAPPRGGKPGPTPKGEQPGEKRTVPSIPSAGGADKGNENAKKRRLNWHSKCPQAAGFEVEFPEGE